MDLRIFREVSGRAHRRGRKRRATARRGRILRKQEGPLKNQRRKASARSAGKAKGKRKGLTCFVCGGIGHPARLCSSGGWVNDLEEDAPEGEETNQDGCWTAEDETLQLGYLGSDSCLTSSPGLRDAFIEAGWTAVTRKSGHRQQCYRRRGCFDKRGTVHGSLWDDDNDMILEQVADDRTKKGMVKISAVVGSGAEANALPENMMQCQSQERSSEGQGEIQHG